MCLLVPFFTEKLDENGAFEACFRHRFYRNPTMHLVALVFFEALPLSAHGFEALLQTPGMLHGRSTSAVEL